MTEEEVEDLSQATSDALQKVDFDITRWKEVGAVSPGVVALLYAWFSNEVYRNGVSGWVGNGYTRHGEHRVLAALTRAHAALDPDMASVLLDTFQQVERCNGDPGALPRYLDALLWERPLRRVDFGLAVAARWDAEADPFTLVPQWDPPRPVLAPTEGPVRYPGVAVGLTERGAHLDVRMEDFDTFDFLNIRGAVVRGLWRAGATDEELARFLLEADEDRKHLAEVCARWISFDGDGGDASRFQRIQDALYPPDPLVPWFPEVKDWHGLFSMPKDLIEPVQQRMKGTNYRVLEQPAAELLEALRAALRWDPDAVGVLQGESLSAADVNVLEFLVNAALTGHRMIVFGLSDAAKQALQVQASRFQQGVHVASLA
jgi:hypothetical protein